MLNKELFQKTTDILYQAYFNDTLRHEDCSACAVGNICRASGAGYVDSLWYSKYVGWASVFYTDNGVQRINVNNYVEKVKRIIDMTGYTWQELAKIELAFETAHKGNSNEDWMYNGLVAVLNVLAEIHQVSEADLLPERMRFNNHYQLINA